MLRPLLLLSLLICIPSARVPANEHEAQFLAGLRQRRLFELAERYCRERLANPQASETARVDLTRELMLTLALHAANSPAAEREARWQAARDVAREFREKQPRHPRAALVELQDALTLLLQGELLQQELVASDQEVATKALPPLREANRQLAELEKRLNIDLLPSRRQPPAAGELTAGELAELLQQVQQQQARALRSLGLCYPAKDENRVSLLLQAVDLLKKSLSRLAVDDPRVAPLQLELAIGYRHLGQGAEAGPLLEALAQEGAPSPLRAQAQAEVARWRLLAGDLAGAARILEVAPAESNVPEFDFARLEVVTAQWRKALQASDNRAEEWQKKCLELARTIEDTHGDAWGQRANQWLVRHAPRTAAAGAELLGKAADQLYLQGQLDDAIAAYDEAAGQAVASKNSTAAFELGYKAALVEQQRKSHRAAAERLRKLSLANKALPAAAEAHRQAAWNLAQALRGESTPTSEYAALLNEHLQTWPQGDVADQVRIWLGRLKESEQAWDEALAAYRGVPRSSPQFAAALSGAIRAGEQQLAELQASGASTDGAARDAIAYYEQAITGATDQLPKTWSPTDGQAAVAAARVVLGYRTSGYDGAELLLNAALAGQPDAPAPWRHEAQSLLVAALAVQPGKRGAAAEMLKSLGAATPQTLLGLLDTLTLIARRARPETAREIAALQLQAVEQLWPERGKLGANVQARLERVRAECLVSTGKLDEAVVLYTRLAQEYPQDGEVQEGFASLLTMRTDRASLQKGLEQWRRVAAKSPPRTERWWRAKYGVADAQYKLGDKAGAGKLIRYLVEVPPGLEGCELKEQFLALLKRSEG